VETDADFNILTDKYVGNYLFSVLCKWCCCKIRYCN